MRGDETRVVNAFCAWLRRHGWSVQEEVQFVDVVAERDGRRLHAEAKGRTAAMGLDVDTLYGQLLRRMPAHEVGQARFCVVVPEEGRQAALRVPSQVRDRLDIDVFVVSEDGRVEHVEGTGSFG